MSRANGQSILAILSVFSGLLIGRPALCAAGVDLSRIHGQIFSSRDTGLCAVKAAYDPGRRLLSLETASSCRTPKALERFRCEPSKGTCDSLDVSGGGERRLVFGGSNLFMRVVRERAQIRVFGKTIAGPWRQRLEVFEGGALPQGQRYDFVITRNQSGFCDAETHYYRNLQTLTMAFRKECTGASADKTVAYRCSGSVCQDVSDESNEVRILPDWSLSQATSGGAVKWFRKAAAAGRSIAGGFASNSVYALARKP